MVSKNVINVVLNGYSLLPFAIKIHILVCVEVRSKEEAIGENTFAFFLEYKKKISTTFNTFFLFFKVKI